MVSATASVTSRYDDGGDRYQMTHGPEPVRSPGVGDLCIGGPRPPDFQFPPAPHTDFLRQPNPNSGYNLFFDFNVYF
ncbi:Hypothetical protein SMAX5B_006848 [Scophthalmus maximus]|uniref:Uncharacterized protein n=1 Tax=Scophthalmus maximus TaxID=52904 RepID=A0A2U9AWJ5_SCOMX|nr:Hypothetical protein SMAX5B_006848 [Scophthalmus maximus]